MTYRDIRSEAMASHDKRQHMYARGGEVATEERREEKADERSDKRMIAAGVHKHESHLHKGEPKTKLRDGGKVEGRARGGKADRPHRGGKTVVNIVAGGREPQPVPVPVPARPPMAGGPGMAPPGPPGAMPPPGGMPPRPVGGMAPMPPGAPPQMPPRARGGKLTGGAMSGVGRLEKSERKSDKPFEYDE